MLTRQSKLVFTLAGAGLVEVMRGFSRSWFEIVELPVRAEQSDNGRP